MTERTQRALWTLLAVIAIGLSAATVYLYGKSRNLTGEKVTGRLVYVSASGTGIPQLYTYDLAGGEARLLLQSRFGDFAPVCQPLQAGEDRGPRVAFLRFRSNPGEDSSTQIGAPGGVFRVGSNGGEERSLSEGVERPLPVAPAWSPDGKQVAFAGVNDDNDDGKYDSADAAIYVSDVESGQVRRVATVHAVGARLQWSPVSPQLILQVHRPDAPVPVAQLLNLNSGELILRDLATTLGCWSPDGKYIAAYSVADRRIHILETSGEEALAIATPADYTVEDMFWLKPGSDASEDRGRLLILCAPQVGTGSYQLNVSSALTGEEVAWRQLPTGAALIGNVAPSPDGRWVVYTQMQEHSSGNEADLYLLNVDGGQPQQLTQDPGYEGLAAWIPGTR